MDEDFSQAHDLAAQYPRKLQALRKLFEIEARKNDVYPFGIYGGDAPLLTDNKQDFVYYPGIPRLQRTAIPPLAGHSYSITAYATIPESVAEGVIVGYGGRDTGFAFYVKDGRLTYENHPLNGAHDVISSDIVVPRGEVVLRFEFEQKRAGPGISYFGSAHSGIGRLFINEKLVGQADLAATLGAGYSMSMGIGEAFGSPVSTSFESPFRFTGTLEKVTVQLNDAR